jgi:hypothetical protein
MKASHLLSLVVSFHSTLLYDYIVNSTIFNTNLRNRMI